MNTHTQRIQQTIDDAARTIASLTTQADAIAQLTDLVQDCFASGGTVYTCGNGGSAAEALHLAEELIGRYKLDRPPLPAVCLCADPTALTCIANDYGFDEIFARQVDALVRPDDLLIVFSTSGNSTNIVKALKQANEHGAATVALLDKGGGACAPLCNLPLIVDSTSTEHIQEAHQVLLHLILERVEQGHAPVGSTHEAADA